MKRCFFILLFVASLLQSCNNSFDYTKVATKNGLLSGRLSSDGKVKIFMGIPYAAAPVGDLRWRAPQPAPAWEGVRQCTDNPPSAIQTPPRPMMMWSQEFMAPEEPISEDCLYLNVWTAATKADEQLPVIVWIHGGGFSGGSGTVPLYDGEELAKKGVVYVTINYRLGLLGFLATPELSAENPNHVSGNYGILDQIAALKWVKDNIAAFGGNPDCITIAGQSAGSMSVNCLLVSPLAKGLFHRAIAQSGSLISGNRPISGTLQNAEQTGTKILADANIPDLAALRALPSDSILKIKAPGMMSPVVDNVVVSAAETTYNAGNQNDVPLILGWNSGDTLLFGPSIENTYKHWGELQLTKGKSPVYMYYFDHTPPGEPNFGAFHSAEFGYTLHTLHLWDRPFTQTDYDLEEQMSSYWVNFARTGNPNGDNLPKWKAFKTDNSEIIIF
ncbi:MAG: carboxylesterase family protein [Tannerella sp.]|jgi:para-nitrobenzyl esterase|nr:carboxylesterase family protein [Tannerella sp.]